MLSAAKNDRRNRRASKNLPVKGRRGEDHRQSGAQVADDPREIQEVLRKVNEQKLEDAAYG